LQNLIRALFERLLRQLRAQLLRHGHAGRAVKRACFAVDIDLPAAVKRGNATLKDEPVFLYMGIGGDRQRTTGVKRVEKGALPGCGME